MRRDLELKYESENSCLISYGCAAHWLNLLGQDITHLTLIIKHKVEVHKYFRNHYAPSAWLKECKECVSLLDKEHCIAHLTLNLFHLYLLILLFYNLASFLFAIENEKSNDSYSLRRMKINKI